jgi:hypothetical protein
VQENRKHRRNDKLPDWFPLPIYAATLDLEAWHREVMLRVGFQTAHRKKNDAQLSRLKPPGDIVQGFISVFVRSEYSNLTLINKSNLRWPISEPSSFEVLFLSEGISNDEEARSWAKSLASAADARAAVLRDFYASEFHNTGQDRPARDKDLAPKITPDVWRNVLGRRVPVMIDLDVDDKSLLGVFDIWLKLARSHLDETAPKRIDERAIERFRRFGVLAAFDLRFWAEINGLTYTDAFIATKLWPDSATDVDEFVDVTERYRKITKPLVDEIFSWPFVERLSRQVELQHVLEHLAANIDAVKAEEKRRKNVPG